MKAPSKEKGKPFGTVIKPSVQQAMSEGAELERKTLRAVWEEAALLRIDIFPKSPVRVGRKGAK